MQRHFFFLPLAGDLIIELFFVLSVCSAVQEFSLEDNINGSVRYTAVSFRYGDDDRTAVACGPPFY